MATVDSGIETLFSDDSPCDLVGSPSACSGYDTEVQAADLQVEGVGPPNIQPYSGVLEKSIVKNSSEEETRKLLNLCRSILEVCRWIIFDFSNVKVDLYQLAVDCLLSHRDSNLFPIGLSSKHPLNNYYFSNAQNEAEFFNHFIPRFSNDDRTEVITWLLRGKEVIRPIAFKPTILTPAPRFGLTGERYGSTPVLTRPGSRLTLYGSSSDLRHMPANVHYSLDRKLRSSCPSTSSSPHMQMSSLTSLPHQLMNYDSLESVRKSPVSVVDGSMMNKSSYRLSSGGCGSLLDLTPSPSDSGVSELEAALRDRGSELAYLRQTMEHNEQVIFRVYQEKEYAWERELRRLKNEHENRLRANAQRTLKLEQMLMTQTYQLQQDKKRLLAEAQRANCQGERLRQEVCVLRGRLEETEWALCQKTGEISLLKSQLKDCQQEQAQKGHEYLQLKSDHRELRETVDIREEEIHELRKLSSEKDEDIVQLKKQIKELQSRSNSSDTDEEEKEAMSEEKAKLKEEIRELRKELSEVSMMSEYEGLEAGRTQRSKKILDQNDDFKARHHCCDEIDTLRNELEERKKDFEKERVIWAQEKEKVLRYQRQLQMNYVQMYRRTRALEGEVESLTIELELDKTGLKKKISSTTDLTQTIEL